MRRASSTADRAPGQSSLSLVKSRNHTFNGMPPLGRRVTRLRGSGACTPSHSKRVARTKLARIAVASIKLLPMLVRGPKPDGMNLVGA